MNNNRRVAKGAALSGAACLILFGSVSNACANNAPGPLAAFSLLSLAIAIVGLTMAGGGYTVLHRLATAKHPSKLKRTLIRTAEFIAGIVLFFVALFATIVGIAGFFIFAVARGIRMIRWAKAAGRDDDRPAHLEGISLRRMRYAGTALIVAAVVVFGVSLARIDAITGLSESRYRERARASQLNEYAKDAFAAAQRYLQEHPNAAVVACDDLKKAGFVIPNDQITCVSDLTATSGSIRISGPDHWKLTKPVAAITFSGDLSRAEP